MSIAKVDRIIDIKGQICPYTLIETKNALRELEKDQVLEVLTDYEPAARTTIPSFCEKKGYPLDILEDGAGAWRLRILRTD